MQASGDPGLPIKQLTIASSTPNLLLFAGSINTSNHGSTSLAEGAIRMPPPYPFPLPMSENALSYVLPSTLMVKGSGCQLIKCLIPDTMKANCPVRSFRLGLTPLQIEASSPIPANIKKYRPGDAAPAVLASPSEIR